MGGIRLFIIRALVPTTPHPVTSRCGFWRVAQNIYSGRGSGPSLWLLSFSARKHALCMCRVPASPTSSACPQLGVSSPSRERSRQTLGSSAWVQMTLALFPGSTSPRLPASRAHPPSVPLARGGGCRRPGVPAWVPGTKAVLVRLWSSSSSGSRLRSVQARHWFWNRVLRTGSLLRTWPLVPVGR